MRVRNKPWAAEKLAAHPQYVVLEPANWKGKWQERFGNDHPIHVEVGSGKGQFIIGMAEKHPDINYIAIERQTSVAVMILEKMEEAQLSNVQILNHDGENVADFFADSEVSQLYLNFSDPWPKKKHEKRRLTHANFLKNYQRIVVSEGELHFKTDNRGLFEYSLASFSRFGLTLKQVWLDLHASSFEGNVMTEYEEKFSAKGQPIYRVEAIFPRK